MTNAHGIASLEASGHLVYDKCQATADELVDMPVRLLPKGT